MMICVHVCKVIYIQVYLVDNICMYVLSVCARYAVAASLDHVYPVWPYISDTGTLPPESCIFGLMLNIGSLLSKFPHI